jgi:formylglycine-generating enzyme required for sulfatase activity
MWQRAAQGDDNREYPWGGWADGRANVYNEKDYRYTTPVTQYAGRDKGDSPYGVSDMAGNVWEWCLTTYYTGDNGTIGDGRRVVRGGAWVNSRGDVRVAIRNANHPSSRSYGVGFRIVLHPTPL